MVPEWVWIIVGIVFGTAMFVVGHYTGTLDADKCPSEHAWINIRKYSIDMNKECALREMELNHEEQMALIERGTFDPLKDDNEEEEEDEDA